MRKGIVAALAAVFFITAGATALASHMPNHSLYESTTGAHFSGYWEWYTSGEYHGGWHFWGYIYDDRCSDGDNVYSKVKVEGYSPRSFYGTECSRRYQNYEVYDPQALYTRHVQYNVCRDRAFPYSDNCSPTLYMDR